MNYDQIMTILMFGLHFERPLANTAVEVANSGIFGPNA